MLSSAEHEKSFYNRETCLILVKIFCTQHTEIFFCLSSQKLEFDKLYEPSNPEDKRKYHQSVIFAQKSGKFAQKSGKI